MLEQITWSSYWIAAIILLVIYYLVVALIFFRSDITKGMKRHLAAGRSGDDEDNEETTSGEDGFKELESIVAKIKATLEEAGKEADKQELLVKIGENLAGYSGLDTPAFRVAINNYIIGYAEKKCALHFEEDELNKYWEQIRR